MIITSPKRCGTNWLVATLRLMTGPREKLNRRAVRGPYNDLLARIESKGKALVYGHMPPELLAPLADRYRIVCMVRDRRDTVVSMAWRYAGQITPDRHLFELRLAQFWEKGGHSNQVAWWDSYAKVHSKVPHLLVRYEDMLERPKEQVLAAWDFLGLSVVTGKPRPDDDLLTTALERVKDGTSSAHPRRRGIAGEWREHFSGDEGAAFYDKHMAATAHLGYSRR